MNDIKFRILNGVGSIFMNESGTDILVDDTLETAITASLFSDALARPDDTIPDGSENRRGFWADQKHGSLLWLLERSPITTQNLAKYREYATMALQWMLDEGAAESVVVTAEKTGTNEIQLTIVIKRPGADSEETYAYSRNWQVMEEQISAS